MHKAFDIDELLRETARQKTEQLQLNALLPHIYANAEPSLETGDMLPPANTAARPGSWRKISLWAACAAAIALVLLLPQLTRQQVIVDGQAYTARGNRVEINGTEYLIGGNISESGETALLNIANTNQYVTVSKTATGEDSILIHVLPPDAPPHPEKRVQDSLPAEYVETMQPQEVYPSISDLVLREGPSAESRELTLLFPGQRMRKVGMYGNWAILEWNGGIAYAFDAYLFPLQAQTPAASSPLTRYATEPVNVRALPGSREGVEILGELLRNEPVQCTGVIGLWTQIDWHGQAGYVFSRYLRNAPIPPSPRPTQTPAPEATMPAPTPAPQSPPPAATGTPAPELPPEEEFFPGDVERDEPEEFWNSEIPPVNGLPG